MKDGFIKVAAVTPKVKVGDVEYNEEQMEFLIEEAASKGAKIIVFPELSLSSYTCGDLFLQESLLHECREKLADLAAFTSHLDSLVFVGLPFEKGGKLYNVSAVLHRGLLLALVPKINIPNYSEFYEARHFSSGNATPQVVSFLGTDVPFGTDILFESDSLPENLIICAEICEDAWVPFSPSVRHAAAGANVIVNLSASDEVIGKENYRKNLISATSAKLVSGYIYSCAGDGESSSDLVFGGGSLIAENGAILAAAPLFKNQITYGEIDVMKLNAERRRMNTYPSGGDGAYLRIPVHFDSCETALSRRIEKFPFAPEDESERKYRCEQVLSLQAMGLKKRLEHIGAKKAVIGISGGLDSTLALLVTSRAFDALGLDRDGILAVTMPCFGTTDRTHSNAVNLTRALGASAREVDIRQAVLRHFEDIGQSQDDHDVTYENSQARERTQVLMDIANKIGGLVVGTGDLSELALGWATYNGDHMSMYGVNAGVPKTLVRHLVRYEADSTSDNKLSAVLFDILDTPVSPELLPPKDGVISQQTEDIVGPYELHDFFIYYALRFGFPPSKIYRLARLAFGQDYKDEQIKHWMGVFYSRFFTQQFKRSCLPDGPKVGTVSLSPRGDLRMPSDAVSRLWMKQVRQLQ